MGDSASSLGEPGSMGKSGISAKGGSPRSLTNHWDRRHGASVHVAAARAGRGRAGTCHEPRRESANAPRPASRRDGVAGPRPPPVDTSPRSNRKSPSYTEPTTPSGDRNVGSVPSANASKSRVRVSSGMNTAALAVPCSPAIAKAEAAKNCLSVHLTLPIDSRAINAAPSPDEPGQFVWCRLVLPYADLLPAIRAIVGSATTLTARSSQFSHADRAVDPWARPPPRIFLLDPIRTLLKPDPCPLSAI